MVISVRLTDDCSNKLVCRQCGFTAIALKEPEFEGKLDFGTWVCPVCRKSNTGLV